MPPGARSRSPQGPASDPSPESEASRRMLDAAVDAFAARGFHATTTRDIAARAGLSPAALYVHYPSKAALLAQISVQGHETALAMVTAAAAGRPEAFPEAFPGDPASARARLGALVARFASWHAEHHRTARVVQYEFEALPEDARARVVRLRREIEHVTEGIVRDGIAEGTMAAEQPRRVARAILSLCVDVARWYDEAGRDAPAEIGELYAELALRMVSADGAAPRADSAD